MSEKICYWSLETNSNKIIYPSYGFIKTGISSSDKWTINKEVKA